MKKLSKRGFRRNKPVRNIGRDLINTRRTTNETERIFFINSIQKYRTGGTRGVFS